MPPHARAHPFERDGLAARTLPFAAIVAFAYALVPLPPSETRALPLVLSGLLTLSIAVAGLSLPWHRLPASAAAVPPLAFLPAVALLREAEGGSASGYAPLVLLPVIWLALHGRRSELAAAIALTAVCLSVPIVLVGGPTYPTTEWRRLLLLVGIAAVVGFTVQQLVRRQHELSSELTELSLADHLTRLPNRRAWDQRLQTELLRADRQGAPLCIAHVDLDHFKGFNDALGHPAGDSLLQASAQAWLAQLRATDVLARYGGDEFAILLPECALEEALAVAERVRAATPAEQHCSIGVAERRSGEGAGELVARADAALYEAKTGGRDRVLPAAPAGR